MSQAPPRASRAQVELMDYLEQQGWKPTGETRRDEVRGLCPLHQERRASFSVNRRKQVFYCHGCGQGGDLVRLMMLLEGISWVEAIFRVYGATHGTPDAITAAARLYRQQLERSPTALHYLLHRGIRSAELIERMGIGYAPGGSLRAYLERAGYSGNALRAAGLIDERGRDRFYRCIMFPLEENGSLYGRSVTDHGIRHRFLARPKGGLYGWSEGSGASEVIVVEGLFDVAALWQSGFSHAVAVMGSHLNERQQEQLRATPGGKAYLCLATTGGGRR